MLDHTLRFATIDLARHSDLCVAFRRDSFVCSYGSDERFFLENGEHGERYLEWLHAAVAEYPLGHVHVWDEQSIIGQIEMRPRPGEPPFGYVNLFYLVPEARGRRLGDFLHGYVVDFFRSSGLQLLRLSVSSTNAAAIAFYRRHGWREAGPGGAGLKMELQLKGPGGQR